MTSAPIGQLSVMALVWPLTWFARLISGPSRKPMSARAARGARSRTARSVSFVTGGTSVVSGSRPHPMVSGHFSGGQLEHPLYGFQRADPQILRQRDLRLPVAHAEVELLQRVEPHVGADAAVAPARRGRRDQLRVRPRLRH